MSGTINTIPASQIVSIVPSVVSAGGSALDLIELMLTTNNRVPIGSILSFPTAASVGAYFGATSNEAAQAAVYFAGFSGATKLPGALLMAQYPLSAVGAYLRGGYLGSLTLTQLQAISGVLDVTVDGVSYSSDPIDLSTATSFTGAAQIITVDLGLTGPTEATATASIGATFTGSSVGTTLTVASTVGVIHPGSLASAHITGTGVSSGTFIVSQTSGTPGGDGVYVTNIATTASLDALTATSTTMDVTALATGALAVGNAINGSGVTAGTYIAALGTGTGGTGTYILTTAQQVPSTAITAVTPTVTWDSVSGAFVVISATTGAASTLSFGAGTIATALALTQATGAVTSQGSIAATPGGFMASVVAQTTDFVSFQTIFDPDAGSGNTQKLLFAAWVNSTGNRYAYLCEDTDITCTESQNATTSLGYILKQADSSGTVPIYEPAGSTQNLAAFIGGAIASLDTGATNGRATLAFRAQTGLSAGITNATAASNAMANGYNYYGAYATANQRFSFVYPGSVSGPYSWIDSYVCQIWLNNALQLALMTMLTQYKSIPYNPAGYGLIRAAIQDPVSAAINFGAIRLGVPLSAAQAAEVNNAAGIAIDATLTAQGYYLQILPASAIVRGARQSPPMTLWYMDGGSVQKINLASVLIQ